MRPSRLLTYWLAAGVAASAQSPRTLTVAAAANLTGVFAEAGPAFQKQTGVPVVVSYGATAQLAQQISQGAPFDLFAAADTGHIDDLIKAGTLRGESRAIYAQGQLALWIPKGGSGLPDLAGPMVRYVAVAQPELAPYGKAAVEALKSSGLWDQVQPKLVYAPSINQAKQFADSGNADAAFTALSLVLHAGGSVIKIDPALYPPIDQALAIVAASPMAREAGKFREFLLGREGRAILKRHGYLLR
jgi:molybdate transport system substrate-binding protein